MLGPRQQPFDLGATIPMMVEEDPSLDQHRNGPDRSGKQLLWPANSRKGEHPTPDELGRTGGQPQFGSDARQFCWQKGLEADPIGADPDDRRGPARPMPSAIGSRSGPAGSRRRLPKP